MKVIAVLLATLAGGLLFWSVLVLSEHPETPDGVTYGSVWHCRPGHGASTGGDMTDGDRAAKTRICQESRRPRWDRAVTLAEAGAAAGVAAGVVGGTALVRRRERTRP